MFGLQDIIAFRPNLELSTNAPALRTAMLARDSEHSKPDAYAESQRRQNNGGWCAGCGSTSGHYAFCPTIRGIQRG